MDTKNIDDRNNEPNSDTERFFLRDDGSLERLAEDAEFPEGYIAVVNPAIISQYIERDGVLKPVDGVHEGSNVIPIKEFYDFKENIEIYMKIDETEIKNLERELNPTKSL